MFGFGMVLLKNCIKLKFICCFFNLVLDWIDVGIKIFGDIFDVIVL